MKKAIWAETALHNLIFCQVGNVVHGASGLEFRLETKNVLECSISPEI